MTCRMGRGPSRMPCGDGRLSGRSPPEHCRELSQEGPAFSGGSEPAGGTRRRLNGFARLNREGGADA